MGRKRIQIDFKAVEEAAADGLSDIEVAARLGISDATLQRRKADTDGFAAAMKIGRARAHAAVSSKLMSLVRKGNLGAIVWYEKTRKGYTDRIQQEISGRDGKPIEQHTSVFDHSAVVADIAARSASHSVASSEDKSSGDGASLG